MEAIKPSTLPIVYPDILENTESLHHVFDLIDVSEATREDYKNRIDLFLDFVSTKGMSISTFLDFKRYLADKNNFSVSTKNKYLITARIFLKELNKQGVLPKDITTNIKGFTQSKRHKKQGLTQEEVQVLAECIGQMPTTARSTRLKAILCLLTLQGLRQIEIVRLNVEDLALADQIAYVQGKGQDDREPIDLHPETVKALKTYLRTNAIASGALFVSMSNNGANQRLTTRSIRRLIKQELKQLGIEKNVHGFRHYFTTTLVKQYQGNLLEVARYTRHKSLEMLQVYDDAIKRKEDLPRFYQAFDEVSFDVS